MTIPGNLRLRLHLAGLLAATLAAPTAAVAASASRTLTGNATVAWHDNVTNADRAHDIVPAMELTGETASSWRWSAGPDDALFLGTVARVEAWPGFDGLDRGAAGIRAGWQHKFGLGPMAPVLRIDTSGELVAAREPGRAGRSGTASISIRRRFGDVLAAQTAFEWSRHDGRAHAFDRSGIESTLLLHATLDPVWRIGLSARWREGSVLSYATPPHPELLAKGKALTTVDTFNRAEPMVAYYFTANTRALRLEFGRAMGRRSELTFAAEIRDTRHGPVSYANRMLVLALNHQFLDP